VPDPTSSGGFNRYAYVNNNPLTNVDPTGHCGGGGDLAEGLVDPVEEMCDGGGGGGSSLGDGGGPEGYGGGGGQLNPEGPSVRTPPSGSGGGTGFNETGNPLGENAPPGSGSGAGSGNNAGTGGQNGTQIDLYKTGNTTGPYDPRIEGYNQTYPEQQVDINIDKNGNVIPNQGGASTYETIEQLPVRGHVWKLPEGSETPGFNVNPDGQPFGNQPPGHVSLVPNEPMSPQQCIECFRNFNWEPVLKPDGFQLKLK